MVESLKTISMEEQKKKYIKSIEKSVKENLFMESLEQCKRQKIKPYVRGI